MRIRFLDSIITEDGPISVGHVRDLADELAQGFISSGHAVRAEPATAPAAPEVEEATAPAAPEVAVSRRRGVR